jgi:EAL domain-containing protein (putative c-di-GMP-specific phosphodiesterase class I)
MLQQLRELGIELSIDDFGTGYSSLSYLHRFPISTLKIDRSFVSCMTDHNENAEIVRTILMLARSLKMNVVAEGVETKDQLAQLALLECEYGQGYYFSRPLSVDAASKLLADRVTYTIPLSSLDCLVQKDATMAA